MNILREGNECFDSPELRAVVLAPIGSHALRADSQIIRRPGWYQVITPSAQGSSLNEVIFSDLSESEVERVIDQTIDQYRSRNLPIRWCVGPWTRPADLGERLARRGFKSWDVRGMVCDARTLRVDAPSDVEVVEVGSDEEIEYIDALTQGWELPASEMEQIRSSQLRSLVAHGGKTNAFVARYRGKTAGTASFILKSDSAYFSGGNVLPEYRGRGIYRALIQKRLVMLADGPVFLVTTQAREATSAPILEKLGFRTVFRSKCFQLG